MGRNSVAGRGLPRKVPRSGGTLLHCAGGNPPRFPKFCRMVATQQSRRIEKHFSYDNDVDRRAGLAMMDDIAASSAGTCAYSQDKVDLGNLVGGFAAWHDT